jgi:hypothetical protein
LHIPKESKKKLNTKTRKYIFVGYNDHSKVYRIYDPIKKKIALSRDIVFYESLVGYQHIIAKPVNQEDPFLLGPPMQDNTTHKESSQVDSEPIKPGP